MQNSRAMLSAFVYFYIAIIALKWLEYRKLVMTNSVYKIRNHSVCIKRLASRVKFQDQIWLNFLLDCIQFTQLTRLYIKDLHSKVKFQKRIWLNQGHRKPRTRAAKMLHWRLNFETLVMCSSLTTWPILIGVVAFYAYLIPRYT